MDSINSIAIKKAVNILQAIKAEFYICYDGNEYREIKPDRSNEKRTRSPRQSVSEHYLADIQKIEVGGSHKWQFSDKDLANRVRSAATAYASKNWGAGSYLSTLSTVGTATVFEILRIA